MNKPITGTDTLLEPRKPSMANNRGMTLIEIMAVLAILGGLLAALGIRVNDYIQKSRVDNTKLVISELGKALDFYNKDCGSYPTTDQGLEALIRKPEGCDNWGPTPYWKKKMTDAWGTPMVYESDGGKYQIKSYGQDKKPDGSELAKDISSDEL